MTCATFFLSRARARATRDTIGTFVSEMAGLYNITRDPARKGRGACMIIMDERRKGVARAKKGEQKNSHVKTTPALDYPRPRRPRPSPPPAAEAAAEVATDVLRSLRSRLYSSYSRSRFCRSRVKSNLRGAYPSPTTGLVNLLPAPKPLPGPGPGPRPPPPPPTGPFGPPLVPLLTTSPP